MTASVFLMDGRAYNVEVEADSLERSFAVTDTDQSGRTLDYTMERDVIGTFYNYAIKVYPKDGTQLPMMHILPCCFRSQCRQP